MSELRKHDPLTKIVECFSQLEGEEEITYQLVLDLSGHKQAEYHGCYTDMGDYMMKYEAETDMPIRQEDVIADDISKKPVSSWSREVLVDEVYEMPPYEPTGLELQMIQEQERWIKEAQAYARKLIKHWEPKAYKELHSVKMTMFLRVDNSKLPGIERQFEAILPLFCRDEPPGKYWGRFGLSHLRFSPSKSARSYDDLIMCDEEVASFWHLPHDQFTGLRP